MRLEKLAQDYIRYKQALGARFKTDAMHLGVFFQLLKRKAVGHYLVLRQRISLERIKTVAYWYRKYAVLNGFSIASTFAAAMGAQNP